MIQYLIWFVALFGLLKSVLNMELFFDKSLSFVAPLSLMQKVEI